VTTLTLLRVLGGALFFFIGAFSFFARYPSVLDRAPRTDDPADRGARRTSTRRLIGALQMSGGLALIALNLFFPD
jgi:hypothetical protein